MEVKIRPTDPTPDQVSTGTIRRGEVYAIRPDGIHLSPADVTAWINGGTIPAAVPARQTVMLEHRRFDHVARRDGFTEEEQKKLATLLDGDGDGLVVALPDGLDPFTIPADVLQEYAATSNHEKQNDALILALFQEDDKRRVLAGKIVARQFAILWGSTYETMIREFWATHGYDSAGWGRLDLRYAVILRMALTWEEATELLAPEYRFDKTLRRPVLVRKRTQKIDFAGILSGPTIAELTDPETVCPVRYDKRYGGTTIVNAEAPI